MRRLLTEEEKGTADIQALAYDFACRVIRLYGYLTEESKEFVLSKQVLRSGTSIGANAREAKRAQSDADFLSKLSIALKEAEESEYWLALLYDNDYLTEPQYTSMHKDCLRIIKILASITKKIKQKVNPESRILNPEP